MHGKDVCVNIWVYACFFCVCFYILYCMCVFAKLLCAVCKSNMWNIFLSPLAFLKFSKRPVLFYPRDEYNQLFGPGTAPLVLARTDAAKTNGFEDAIRRCLAFREAGCDMTFLEAPESVEQMEEYCRRVEGPKLANMLEQGSTPILPPAQLKQMGYTMAAYPLTLLSASIKAMQESLERIQNGTPTDDMIATFADTKDTVGFTRYAQEEQRYKVD